MKIVFIGTELAQVGPRGGAIERLVWGWAHQLARESYDVYILSWGEVNCGHQVHVSDLDALIENQTEIAPDVTIVNNRPLWGPLLQGPIVHILHNSLGALAIDDSEHAREVLGNDLVLCVSSWLAIHLADELSLSIPPYLLPVFVDDAFMGDLSGPRFVCCNSDSASNNMGKTPGPGDQHKLLRTKGQIQRNSLGPGDQCNSLGPGDQRNVLFPNRLMAKKGVQVLLDALEILGPPWHGIFPFYISPWTIPTDEHLQLAREIENHEMASLVEAFVNPWEMAQAMNSSEIVAVCSIEPEGLGIAALESQALGIKTVTCRSGGLIEATFSPNITCEPNNPVELARAIVEIDFQGEDEKGKRVKLSSDLAQIYGIEASTSVLKRHLNC